MANLCGRNVRQTPAGSLLLLTCCNLSTLFYFSTSVRNRESGEWRGRVRQADKDRDRHTYDHTCRLTDMQTDSQACRHRTTYLEPRERQLEKRLRGREGVKTEKERKRGGGGRRFDLQFSSLNLFLGEELQFAMLTNLKR